MTCTLGFNTTMSGLSDDANILFGVLISVDRKPSLFNLTRVVGAIGFFTIPIFRTPGRFAQGKVSWCAMLDHCRCIVFTDLAACIMRGFAGDVVSMKKID